MSEIGEFRSKEPNYALAKKLNVLVWILTIAVLGLVGMMQTVKIPIPDHFDLSALPGLHAFLNSLAALFLIGAILAIKKSRAVLHQKCIYLAMACSLIFLLSYVCYHFTADPTKYGDLDGNGLLSDLEREQAGYARIFYLVILFTHIALAAISFPFILFSLCLAITNQFDKHKKLTRWVFPIWLYVAITGPLVYFLLRPYY